MKIAIRENEVFPETYWHDWIKNYTPDMGIPYITESPYNYQIITVTDDINVKYLRFNQFEFKNGVYTFNKDLYDKFVFETESKELNEKYIPAQSESLKAFAKLYLQTASIEDDDVKLSISGMCDDWKLGNYVKGELVNISGQTWECSTAHDTNQYPDIIPSKPQTWANFWRPLHGKTKETARPWCKPVNGTTDIYHIGEYMIWTDGSIKKCLRDTNYSPEEYPADWENVA